MVFNSVIFIFCFLPIFLLIYYFVPARARNPVLFCRKPFLLCMGRSYLSGSYAVFQLFQLLHGQRAWENYR